jgi:hypothetical protein
VTHIFLTVLASGVLRAQTDQISGNQWRGQLGDLDQDFNRANGVCPITLAKTRPFLSISPR